LKDCQIKLWSLKNINFNSQSQEIEPYLILRGHTGPLYSLAISPDDSNLLYTAGNEGIIKVWKIPKLEEVNQYGDTDVFSHHIGLMLSNNEVIWDLKHHPTQVFLT
jgi:striatin 1/3/4